MMNSLLHVLNVLSLQFLWACHSAYENLFSSSKKCGSPSDMVTPFKDFLQSVDTTNLHILHVFTTPNRKPNRYMNACEIISPAEEEMLRCACGKGVSNVEDRKPDDHGYSLPKKELSREKMTSIWIDSFTLFV